MFRGSQNPGSRSMRVLFGFLPHWSHFAPMVPLAAVLQAQGHDVIVAAPQSLGDLVTSTGMCHVPLLDHLDMRVMIGFDDDGVEVPDPPALSDKLVREGQGFARASLAMLDPTERLMDEWRPDLVVSDPAAFGVRIAAARRSLPVVLHEWGMPIPKEITDATQKELVAELAEVDVHSPALTIETRPSALSDESVPNRQRMRFVPFNGSASLPLWSLQKPDRPRVCLTFGSTLGSGPQTAKPVRALAKALTDQGFEVLLAIGNAGGAESLQLPDGVRLVGWLPLSKVLPTCGAVLHHGGSGSTLTAMALAVPQIAMPMFADQFANARWVNRLGVGYGLEGAIEPLDIVAACTTLVDDGEYRERAREVQADIERQPSPVEVAAILEKLVS